NNCHYCMAAHSTVAKMVGLPDHILEALRKGGELDDPKLNALATFTRRVVQDRGWVKDEDVQKFLDAGYTQANIYDVILGVAHKTISNYVNHIFQTPVDDAFQPQAWSRS
ncbi:MAG: carboxymuconolactone decarboxylase family protein, partial [Pseudomonadota bacterium]